MASSDKGGPIKLPREERKRVLKGAHVIYDVSNNSMSCAVKDLSKSGAKISFPSDSMWRLPAHFTLIIDIDGYKVDCERRWLQAQVCGVHFTSEKVQIGATRPQISDPVKMPNYTLQPTAKIIDEASGKSYLPKKNAGFGKRSG